MGLVALQHLGSWWVRDWTHVSCIGRRILYHWATREVWVTHLHLTLCDPINYSSLGSSVHGILQTRILDWVAIPFSKQSSWPRDWTRVSHTVGRFFTIWAIREASPYFLYSLLALFFFPHSSVGKESACNAGDPGSIPGLWRFAREGIGYHSSILGLLLWLSW